jgi:hypothetical protein
MLLFDIIALAGQGRRRRPWRTRRFLSDGRQRVLALHNSG